MLPRDVATLMADYTEDAVIESPWAGTVKGREANAQVYRGWWSAFLDHHVAHERRIYDFTGMLVRIGALKAKPV